MFYGSKDSKFLPDNLVIASYGVRYVLVKSTVSKGDLC
jgi:hypothetical protein